MGLRRAGDGGHSSGNADNGSGSGDGGGPGPGDEDALGTAEISTNWTDPELERAVDQNRKLIPIPILIHQ